MTVYRDYSSYYPRGGELDAIHAAIPHYETLHAYTGSKRFNASQSASQFRALGYGSGYPRCSGSPIVTAVSPSGARIPCHATLAPLFKYAMEGAETGLWGAFDPYWLIKAQCGGFVCRGKMRTDGTMSSDPSGHSFACTCDWNWSGQSGANAMRSSGFSTDMPPWLVLFMRALGFSWGGDWAWDGGLCDAMHFEQYLSVDRVGRVLDIISDRSAPLTPAPATPTRYFAADVSQWQGVFDWNAIRARGGDELAIMRATVGMAVDTQFDRNRRVTRDLFKRRLFYAYLKDGDVTAQADLLLATVGELAVREGVMLDAEEAGPADDRVVAWVRHVETATGLEAQVYSGMNGATFAQMQRRALLVPNPLTWPNYTTETKALASAPRPWTVWQQKQSGVWDSNRVDRPEDIDEKVCRKAPEEPAAPEEDDDMMKHPLVMLQAGHPDYDGAVWRTNGVVRYHVPDLVGVRQQASELGLLTDPQAWWSDREEYVTDEDLIGKVVTPVGSLSGYGAPVSAAA